ncbi:hypothetical protein [Granulosicoccus antarcticus]|uniref:Uncharacterized protein n=1 Tax=Granulosicoccus antarcticus IMCC3135 TaxID=1192854 RepID=A0A2Z2NU00_9GAMM|nr:hypothetical protein [Granulosicoccus antarcticus]ASJ72240.1 hypothetical protein IMCC3135_10740 [Granulosicoccus antarcticus IMCC3135]
MISSSGLAVAIRKAISVQAVGLAAVLLLGIALYLLDMEVTVPARLAAVLISLMLLTASHLWLPDLKLQSGHTLWVFILIALVCAMAGSLLVIALLIFGVGPREKLFVSLLALQSVHLVLYAVNWFFFDEREIISHKSPTAMELASMDLGTGSLSPARQGESTGSPS